MRGLLLILTATTLCALPAAPGAAQSVERGVLLAAAPTVTGFHFARSVVLVVHHDENGSLGLIVNRPTRLSAAETFDELESLGDYEGRVYLGGPLDPARPLLLVNDPEDVVEASQPVLRSVHIAADTALVERHPSALLDEDRLRVYAGHVQWEPGQLEAEIAGGNWRVLPGSVEAVFSEAPLELYGELGASGSLRAAR